LDVRGLGRNFKGLRELADVVHNDLELVTAAKYPEIEQIKKMLTENGAVRSWMSGSGPTVVGMFGSESVCAEAAKVAKEKNAKWRVIETSNRL
ncbi:MAG: 4-(cytidine 5'-diphospho)-2-C-methyl-D-erythritol kinase, partial [Deltaproteobacteria bacterium]|nr:4-(cytidine 5'-diphospho)-2-C-methyl-D-erythritol kinase [Deltaproteobacteria bacterium]